tara:strand:- start:28195 stop:32406 length:4212 start_codon:yes stop_codon:yes gene_type:complete
VLVLAARHHPPSRRKIKEIWHGRVHWEEDSKTTMLRSSAEEVLGSVEPKKVNEISTNLGSIGSPPKIPPEESEKAQKADTKPMIAICAATHSKSNWRSLDDTALEKLLIPSIQRTISSADRSQYDFRLYLAADHDDQFWLNNQKNVKTPDWLSVQIGFYEVPEQKIPFNPMMRAAYNDGAEYLVRINDDSEFVTSDWVSKTTAKLATYDPPNVGMVGPNCREGNTAIMTHDMVHRTHLDIFEHYYPDVFSAWWVDDWISKVYGPQRSTKMMDWTVKHHTHKHGTRYTVQHHEAQLLQGELEKGAAKIAKWVSGARVPEDGFVEHAKSSSNKDAAEWTVLITLSAGFDDVFLNWWAFYSKLNLGMDVIMIAEDEQTYNKHINTPGIEVWKSLYRESAGALALTYKTHLYNRLVSRRASHLIRVLKAKQRVIYSDIDTAWLADPRPFLTGNFDMWAQLDNTNYYCTGFMAFIRTAQVLQFLDKWDKQLLKQPQLNQPLFNKILKGAAFPHKSLPRKEFPSGNMYFDQNKRKDVVVVHNNFIIGKDKKIQRFKDVGLWRTRRQTTIVLMGYSTQRNKSYKTIFEAYGSMDLLIDKIIFIWNNFNEPHPPIPDKYKTRIQLVRPIKNSMNNRYNVSQYIRTSSVITVDDDVVLTKQAILSLINEYEKNPDMLIGLDERYYSEDGKYWLGQKSINKLVIGKTMMWNVKYGDIYFEHSKLVEFTDTHPCEDIAMNFLIRSITKKEPVIIKSARQFRSILPEPGALSLKPGWSEKRDNCVAFMLEYFRKKEIAPVDNTRTLTFMGNVWCVPPYHGIDCQQTSDTRCSELSDQCHFSSVYGVANVPCERWHGAQKTEQITWDSRDTDVDRNAAHAKSFGQYSVLPPNLGHVVEIGSGPFTQSKTIMSSKTAISITLLEPMALHYMKNVKKCFYQHGQFSNIPTTILSTPAESIPKDIQFDTVVMINVIEHVYDAFEILKRSIELVKPGGYFVWHERLWNKYNGRAKHQTDREFKLHPVRLKSAVVDAILPLFDVKYKSYDTDELRRLKNEGVYFIGQRNSKPLPATRLPVHPKCLNSEIVEPGINAVLITNGVGLMGDLQTLYESDAISQIILVFSGLHNERLELEKFKSKLITVISGHDDWRSTVDQYVNKCETTASIEHLNDALKNAGVSSTICFEQNGNKQKEEDDNKQKEDIKHVIQLLTDLDAVINEKAPESKIYGNVFSGHEHQQLTSYTNAIKEFLETNKVQHICEIGFAGGHSATILLAATASTGAMYTGFDMWDRGFYENSALEWVKQQFPERKIQIVKGDSTKTVPSYNIIKTCDIIHVDGAHHAHYPKTDYANMHKLASEKNILLIDDCTESWPAVMNGVSYITSKGLVTKRPESHHAIGWTHRGKKKGWCIGSYKKVPK